MSDKKVLVVAPSHRWFMTWCQIDNDPPLNPHDPRYVVVASAADVDKMQGLKPDNAELIRLGMPPRIRDADAIYSMLKERGW